MQRRRMSPFVKMMLHTAHQVTHTNKKYAHLPVVFSSRHGDFSKTSTLLAELGKQELLSPKDFGLSVHNAAVGMYSIITGNHQPMSAIAAGKESFPCALIESYIKLIELNQTDILLIHTDESLPAPYTQFIDERQITHSIAVVISLVEKDEPHFSLIKQETCLHNELSLPLSLDFADAMFNKHNISAHGWQLTYHG